MGAVSYGFEQYVASISHLTAKPELGPYTSGNSNAQLKSIRYAAVSASPSGGAQSEPPGEARGGAYIGLRQTEPHQTHPYRYSPATVRATKQNIRSSWTSA